MMSEGGEKGLGTNINALLENFGVVCNDDTVVRTMYHKYHHPKEVFVQGGVLNRNINKEAGKSVGTEKGKENAQAGPGRDGLSFVYPYGASLAIAKDAKAVPILSSGHIAYPVNRPVGVLCESKKGGRMLVLGSSHIFHDDWIGKEENAKLQEVLFKLVLGEFSLDTHDAKQPDINPAHFLPDTEDLAGRVRCALQESEELPLDPTTLFDDSLFKFDTSLIPEAIQLYTQLEVKHEPLTLIPPNFETPLPPLLPATFPPVLRDLPPPDLDLYDLDEHFASEQVRLAQLANKCKTEDIEYFVKEAGDILGITGRLNSERRTAKDILEYCFRQVVHFKKLNQETGMAAIAAFDPAAMGQMAPTHLAPLQGSRPF
jgi:intraflagellar transport protein 52